ncbi:MAG: FAD-binding oxidoreductase [Candidatus Izemoplasmatales bacterium]|jgi:sarcosine oxidase subunit beta|nr:FAD-binding oxidoreductase [Candidatus Izemoplasmatales bacterium]MDD3865174.1 FAD-binding oxidoreductase [Candidatus Izemoplasmatales bacterium]
MNANIVIIGAGISGTAIAYYLAAKGMKDIVVVDKGYLTNGATGRCGAGIRQQWATKMNCIMAKKSVEFYEKANQTLKYPGDIEFKQEGYLIVAVTPEEDAQFSKNVELQNSLGIKSRKITKEEAKEIVPHINTDMFISATFCPTDGHINPFKANDAFYQAAKRLGVSFYFHEAVQSIQTVNHKVVSVTTDKHTFETNKVVNAAGGFAHEIGLMAGVPIPVYPEKHEILVTEPIEKIQGPMVMSFGKNLYCQQVPQGSFVMGRGTPGALHNHDIESSWEFLDEMAKTVVAFLPVVGELRVIRQWAGSYNMSPDRQPILGTVDECEGFYVACGFSGHGFMFAPITGLLLSEIILNQPTSIDMTELCMNRFKNQKTIEVEKSVV